MVSVVQICSAFGRIESFLLLLLLTPNQVGRVTGKVIPPPWANETVNPCALESWQLLYWPQDDRCYYIFQQGPCAETQELYYNEDKGRSSCRCSRGTIWHEKTKKCYKVYTQGPCGYKEYFAFKSGSEERDGGEVQGECRQYKQCPPGHLFWPSSGMCFLHLSRGPCLHGHLLYVDPQTGSTECGCEADLMSTNYWTHGESCHELFTQGPCVDGHLFIYNLTQERTECVCGPHLVTNYHQQTGRCYEIETIGPCEQGQIFSYDSLLTEARCSCRAGHVMWQVTGTCYRSFTRGPCGGGQFLKPERVNGKERGLCEKNPCSSGQLYDPQSARCYSVGRRGPCQRGKLWVFERAASVRGLCHCDAHLIGYWGAHEVCYELGERGPCPKRKVLFFDRRNGLQCRCDLRRGFVSWVNGRCIKAGVRKNKLIPVSGPARSPLGTNVIQGPRVHRGLTLPKNDQIEKESVVQRPALPSHRSNEREGRLKKALLVLPINASSNAVEGASGPLCLRTETQTETAIHRITVSRSVTERRTLWQQGERVPHRLTTSRANQKANLNVRT